MATQSIKNHAKTLEVLAKLNEETFKKYLELTGEDYRPLVHALRQRHPRAVVQALVAMASGGERSFMQVMTMIQFLIAFGNEIVAFICANGPIETMVVEKSTMDDREELACPDLAIPGVELSPTKLVEALNYLADLGTLKKSMRTDIYDPTLIHMKYDFLDAWRYGKKA